MKSLTGGILTDGIMWNPRETQIMWGPRKIQTTTGAKGGGADTYKEEEEGWGEDSGNNPHLGYNPYSMHKEEGVREDVGVGVAKRKQEQ